MASITTGGVTTALTSLAEPSKTVFELGVSRALAIGAASANTALTSTCRYISVIAVGGTHCHIQIGVGAQTATATSHYIRTGERVFLSVPANANIAVIQGTGASTTLYVSELTD